MNASEAREKAASVRKSAEATRNKRFAEATIKRKEELKKTRESCKLGGFYYDDIYKKIQKRVVEGCSTCTYSVHMGSDRELTEIARDALRLVLESDGYTVKGGKITSEHHEGDSDWPHPPYWCLVCELKISW